MSELLERATAWMAELHPHFRHMQRTLDWAVEIDPQAGEAVRIAAVTHDAERAYPEGDWDSAVSWNDPEYNRWHQERCAQIVGAWLREQGADPELVEQVERIVLVHEEGGFPEADVVQAADSLSFLETMVHVIAEWVQSGRAPRANAEGKARHSLERISPDLPLAREEAAPLLAAALQRLAAVPAPDEVLAAMRLVKHGRLIGLARDRFPRMPVFPGHPAFEVLSYRTPQGIRAAGDTPWGPSNDAGLGYMSEMVMGTTHSGAHIDAHAHMTIGAEDRWNGGSAQRHLGDFGPLRGDATEIPALWRRGVLYDVPGHRGVDYLGRAEAVSATELEEIETATGVARRLGRRGAGAHGLHAALARPRRDGRASGAGSRRVGRAPAGRPRGDRGRLGHRDLRGTARAGPRRARRTRSPCTPCCSSSGGSTSWRAWTWRGWPRAGPASSCSSPCR